MTTNRPVIAITGAGSGIGRATALLLAREGADVILLGRRQAHLQETLDLIGDSAGSHRAISVDVGDDEAVTSAFTTIAELDGLVNAAGMVVRGEVMDSADQEWLTQWEVNLMGVLRCCRSAHPLLARSSGSIVNVGSTSAHFGFTGRVAYGSTKAALEGLTRGLAVEWAPDGIRVNSVLPGWTRTEMVAEAVAQGRLDESAVNARLPLGRLAEPDEIAGVIAFLLSSRASYMTGQGLIVDGGFLINADSAPTPASQGTRHLP